ncbi:hypothetical protein HWV62_31829 [Athelia sp. TMB]|nr:hypothetical protein HWV62_31829 [Athelia sp. TMB]
MVCFNAFTSSAILSFAASAIAGPVSPQTFVTHPITKKASKSITSTLVKDQTRLAKYNAAGSVLGATITNEVDSYIAAVKIGTQTKLIGIKFSLIVDTGSSNIWVGAGTKFIKGSTGITTGDSVSVSYGSGSFFGTEYIDTVTVGNATVLKQSIGVASSSTGFEGVDGIIGFGPADLTEGTVLKVLSGVTTVATFMDNLYSQHSIPTEVLGISLAPESGSDDDDANGELTFGGTDPSKYTGNIAYTPKSTSSLVAPYWGVAVSAITYGGTSLGSGSGIVDTGTTLIYIPTSAYTKLLSASGGETDSITGLAKFTTKPTSTFSLTIGGTTFPLTPAQYLVPTAQYANLGISGSAYYSWINDGGSSGVDIIIGQKFLENYYSVFDTTYVRPSCVLSIADMRSR